MLIVLILAVAIGSSSLFVLYGSYNGQQKGNVVMNGIQSDILFDSVRMSSQEFSIPMDITELTNGDSETFIHEFEVLGTSSYDYDIMFDYSNMSDIFTDPLNEFYGFGFDIQVSNISILDSVTVVRSGESISMDFIYSLDSMFMDTIEDLPYEINVMIVEHVPLPPIANFDSVTYPSDSAFDYMVLDNDLCPEGGDLELISFVDIGDMDIFISGTYPNQFLRVWLADPSPTPAGTYTSTYTIESSLTGLQSTGTFEIIVT